VALLGFCGAFFCCCFFSFWVARWAFVSSRSVSLRTPRVWLSKLPGELGLQSRYQRDCIRSFGGSQTLSSGPVRCPYTREYGWNLEILGPRTCRAGTQKAIDLQPGWSRGQLRLSFLHLIPPAQLSAEVKPYADQTGVTRLSHPPEDWSDARPHESSAPGCVKSQVMWRTVPVSSWYLTCMRSRWIL
jgi:hypothetical protein